MSRSLRRYEILLPLQFNDGQPVPNELVGDVLLELRRKFGAVSLETQTIRGIWQHEEISYRDDLTKLFVDVTDTADTRQFFVEFKETLKAKFKQIDIWMTTYPIEAI